METKNVAQWLVDFLKAEEVDTMFGVIGGALLEILNWLRPSGIRFVPTQHELSAAYMADGYARETGKPGVCLFTVGPGATNSVTGVAQAYVESSPVVVIAGEVESLVYRKGASIWHEIDQTRLFEPITKESIRIERPDRILEGLERAFRVATTGRQGPVYVGIPADFQKEQVTAEIHARQTYRPGSGSRGNRELVQRAAECLREAERPFLLAGGGVHWSRAKEDVLKLAELLRAPVANTPLHKGIIPEDHPLALGPLGDGGRPHALEEIRSSDLLLALGCTFSQASTTIHFPEHSAKFGHDVIPKSLKIIQVDIDPEEIGKNYPVEIGIVGDAGAVVRDLLSELQACGFTPRPEASARIRRIEDVKRAWDLELEARSRLDDGPVTRVKLFRALGEVFSDDAIFLTDEGHVDFLLYFKARRVAYFSGDWRTIGFGLPMAIGLKIAYPSKPVVAICGDGAFSMSLQELTTMKTQEAAPVIVVVNNAGYSGLRGRLIQFYGSTLGTDFSLPDLKELARLFDLHGESVENASQLKPALERCAAANKGALVDVKIA